MSDYDHLPIATPYDDWKTYRETGAWPDRDATDGRRLTRCHRCNAETLVDELALAGGRWICGQCAAERYHPAQTWPKRCSCGADLSLAQWLALPCAGVQPAVEHPDPSDPVFPDRYPALELRTHQCGSTSGVYLAEGR